MNKKLPAWATGLAFAPLGFYYGFISTALPTLLASHGVSIDRIESISSSAFSPTFWAFLLCPILDVRFTKRTYCFFFTAVSAVCLGASTLTTHSLGALTLLVMIGCTTTVIFGNAIAGWLADVIGDEHYDQVGAWSNVANLGAAGAFGALTVMLVRHLPAAPAAGVLGLVVMAPTALLFFIPLPAEPTRGIVETFRTFFRDLYAVCRKRSSVLGLICFLSPAGSFALTNIFSGMGKDFHVPEYWIAWYGPAVAVICSAGCLVSIWICGRVPRRIVYVSAGFGGAVSAILMIFTHHTMTAFVVGMLAYNFFQGVNYTAFSALTFEIVGPRNPLSGTQMALLAASGNLPICYMSWLEGRAYKWHGIPGMFGLDATATIVIGTGLLTLFFVLSRRERSQPTSQNRDVEHPA